jgi:hypothetical protein
MDAMLFLYDTEFSHDLLFRLLILQVQELLESKPLPPKLRINCITALLSIFSLFNNGDQSDDAASRLVPRNVVVAQARKGRIAAGSERVDGPQTVSEKKLLPRSRRRIQSESTASLGLFSCEAAGSDNATRKRAVVSSCSCSDSDTGFLSGLEDSPSTKRSCLQHATRSVVSKPCTAGTAISSQDCDTFLASCERIHIQCKLVRILNIFHHFNDHLY